MRRPRFIAEQARHATGAVGRIIAFIMARETWQDNLNAIDALGIRPGDHVLDLGTGHGRSLGELARRAPGGSVTGADPSALMIKTAARRNRELARSGVVELVQADVSQLPFTDSAFDKVLCVHVVYFWDDIGSSLREIVRVMKPGGVLALMFRTAASKAAAGTFPSDIYRFPTLGDISAAMTAAGLLVDSDYSTGAASKAEPATIIARKSAN